MQNRATASKIFPLRRANLSAILYGSPHFNIYPYESEADIYVELEGIPG